MTLDLDRLNYIEAHIGELEIPDVVWLIAELRAARERIAECERALKPFAVADRALGGERGPFRFDTGTGYRLIEREDLRFAGAVFAGTAPPPQPRVTDEAVEAALTAFFGSKAEWYVSPKRGRFIVNMLAALDAAWKEMGK